MNRGQKIILALIIVLTLISIALYVRNKYMLSYIRSPSMEPTYNTGDLVIIEYCKATDIEIGDVIVFRSPYDPDMLILHRVAAIKVDNGKVYFLTKGDNNPDIDPWGWVPEDNLVGKLIARVPYVGYIFLAFDEAGARFLLVLLIILIAIFYMATGSNKVISFSPFMSLNKEHVAMKIIGIIVILMIIISLSGVYTSSISSGIGVEIKNARIKEYDSVNYILIDLDIKSHVNLFQSISQIDISVFLGNRCIGFGRWTIIYPFMGEKDVSIAIQINETLREGIEINFSIILTIKNYLNNAEGRISLERTFKI